MCGELGCHSCSCGGKWRAEDLHLSPFRTFGQGVVLDVGSQEWMKEIWWEGLMGRKENEISRSGLSGAVGSMYLSAQGGEGGQRELLGQKEAQPLE